MLRSAAAYLAAGALLLLSTSAFRQAVGEFRDTEPGSLLFGALQVVIGSSAVMAAVGLVRRARWAPGAVAVWGLATAALVAVQPLFEPMDADARWSIWTGAGAIVVVAAGVSWFAHRRHRAGVVPHEATARAPERPSAPMLPFDTLDAAVSSDVRAPDAPTVRTAPRHDAPSHGSVARRTE